MDKQAFRERKLMIQMGSYKPFGDLLIDLQPGPATDYERALDLQQAVHRVAYAAGGVRFTREAFASFPDLPNAFSTSSASFQRPAASRRHTWR